MFIGNQTTLNPEKNFLTGVSALKYLPHINQKGRAEQAGKHTKTKNKVSKKIPHSPKDVGSPKLLISCKGKVATIQWRNQATP